MNSSPVEGISREESSHSSRWRRSATAGYYGAFIIFGLLTAAIGPTLLGLGANTESDKSEISLIFTAQALGYLTGSLSGGRLFDRLPGHRLLASVLLVIGVLAFFIPLISTLWLLLAVFLVLGAMQGAIEVGSNTLLVWLYRDRVGPYMNALHFFFGIGAVLSPVIIARITAASGNIAWVYWILAFSAIPIALWLARLPSPAARSESDLGQAGKVNYLLVFLVALLLFLYVGAEASYGGWVFTYAVDKFPTQAAASAALLTAAFWGALTVGRLISIPLAIRLKPGTVLVGDLLSCLFSILLIAIWPDSVQAIWLGTIGLGLFMASFFPTVVTLAGQRMQITGQISGWFFVGAGAGGMFLPWLIGQLFEVFGAGITISLILVDVLVALGVLAMFLSLTNLPQKQPAEQVMKSGS